MVINCDVTIGSYEMAIGRCLMAIDIYLMVTHLCLLTGDSSLMITNHYWLEARNPGSKLLKNTIIIKEEWK